MLMFQRSRYDIWRGFGSDGYLYDFVSKRSGEQYEAPEVEDIDTPNTMPVIHRSQRSRYDIWRGFGSDGYLYDFVKKRSGGHTQDYKNSLLLLGQSFIGGRGPDIIYGEGLGLMAFCMTLSSRLVW